MDSFGTIRLVDGGWVIECEPHVRARLKRVFGSAPQRAADSIRLSDTPEHARDLEWFLERYPMKVLAAKHLAKQARAHRGTEDRIADLLLHRGEVPHIELAKPPREYQEVAAQHLEVRGGLLLADDVGVGKTVSGICSMRQGENLPALVVVPAHLPKHWQDKLAEFAPDLHLQGVVTSAAVERDAAGRKETVRRGPDRESNDCVSTLEASDPP